MGVASADASPDEVASPVSPTSDHQQPDMSSVSSPSIALSLTLHPLKPSSGLLAKQNEKCYTCNEAIDAPASSFVSKIFTKSQKSKYCHYYGRLVCAACVSKSPRVIPARVLYNADVKEVGH